MKKTGIIAALCCLFTLCLVLVGCGGGAGNAGNADDESAAKAAFSGSWDLVGMSQDGKETNQEDIDMLAAMGLEVYLNLNEDGTSELMMFDETLEGTWEASSTTSAIVVMDGQDADATIEDDKLIMQQGASSLTFVKGEPRSDAAAASGESSDADGESSESASAASDEAEEAEARPSKESASSDAA